MRRGPYTKVAARNGQLLARIRALKAEHSVLGLSADLGLSELRRRLGGQSKARLRHHEGQRGGGETESQAVRQAQSGHPEAAADPTQRVVGIDMIKVISDGFGWVPPGRARLALQEGGRPGLDGGTL
jgi:hypothetical protein